MQEKKKASLVLGILSIVLGLLSPIVGLILGIIGLVLGNSHQNQSGLNYKTLFFCAQAKILACEAKKWLTRPDMSIKVG